MKLTLTSLLLILFAALPAAAQDDCLGIDWMYNLHLRDIDADTARLADFCSPEACAMEQGLVAVKSHFDPAILVIIADSEIIWRLPYQISALGLIAFQGDAQAYNWHNIVKVDLEFLKHNGLIVLPPDEIEEISLLAKAGEMVFSGQEGWKRESLETYFDCQGAMPLLISPPQDILNYELETSTEEAAEAGGDYCWTIALFFAAVITVAAIRKKDKKING